MIGTSDPRERYFEPFFACCERVQVRPVVTQYAQDLATRLWMVACGFGFSPTTASSQEISRPGLAYRPLPADGPEVLTFAAHRKQDQGRTCSSSSKRSRMCRGIPSIHNKLLSIGS